ncbi:lipopolysaccharide kinase InaA family protein [Pseudomonas indica]|uniref:lipopolysaccharide kinase InaA family protein n=1 Tax=Pseudomonas indica TaxID=137658 RepID=UPI003FD36602
MKNEDFIAEEDRARLRANGLDDFDALWQLRLEAVDTPNTERGGWSSVFRLELDGAAYYLKRQCNHLTRSLAHPFGEPTFAREFRNIRRYRELGIPALQAAFFGMRRVPGEQRAILLTRALDDWRDLDSWLSTWPTLDAERRVAILHACGGLAKRLHEAGQMHGCFYPKHIFLREHDGAFDACLIDLEKTRPVLFGQRDRVKDLEPLVRRSNAWSEADVREFLTAYLPDRQAVEGWSQRLSKRQRQKEARR